MYYLVNEWSLDDERLRKDLEQIGLPIQSLQLENILDSIFFNQKVDSPLHMTSLPLPPFWEVCANGDIVSDGMKRGKIDCFQDRPQRVKKVDWYDPDGHCSMSDNYDRSGSLFLKEVWSADERHLSIYTNDRMGKLYLFHQHDRAIYQAIDGLEQGFSSIEEAKKALLQEALLQAETVFLSDPELMKTLPKLEKEQIIFYGRSTLPEAELAPLVDKGVKVFVRDANGRASHDRLLFFPTYLGDLREFQPQVLILTNTQEIEQIEVLVTALPHFQFHIAALTEMGERLVRLNDYPNVHLYPGISGENYERLLNKCRIYLDIAYADEILDGNRMALEKGMILYAFEETCHRPNVYTKDHLFQKDAITDLIDELSQLEDPKKYQSAYDKQKMHPALATKEELKMIVQMTENKEGKL